MREIYRPLYLIETPIVDDRRRVGRDDQVRVERVPGGEDRLHQRDRQPLRRVGADVHVVAKGMGLDKRIGSKFLHPGPGYGGSCFPKDTRALAALGDQHAARRSGSSRPPSTSTRGSGSCSSRRSSGRSVASQAGRIAVLGLAFKPNTDDVRESPALYVCRELAAAGASVRAFDPVACAQAAADARATSRTAVTFRSRRV